MDNKQKVVNKKSINLNADETNDSGMGILHLRYLRYDKNEPTFYISFALKRVFTVTEEILEKVSKSFYRNSPSINFLTKYDDVAVALVCASRKVLFSGNCSDVQFYEEV